MNNYNDVSREGLEDMLEEATEEIGILRKRMKEFKQVEANYDALQSPMPCGHLAPLCGEWRGWYSVLLYV